MIDKEEVRARMPMRRLLEEDGVELRRSGAKLVARCPFHDERSGSFTVHKMDDDHAHCYGCGWHGDIFTYEREKRGGTWVEVFERLAARALVSPAPFNGHPRKVTKVTPMVEPEKDRPALPPLEKMTMGQAAHLAALRGISAAGVLAAVDERLLGVCRWPQWENEDGTWTVARDATDCWVMGDRTRRVVQFRRMDGEPFVRKDGGKIKAWTKGSPTWPLGAAQLGARRFVLMVEGGADMLAALDFVVRFGAAGRVGVVGMLGASMRIAESALPHFAGTRVRIMMDEDQAGTEAAARWTEQLTEAGAAVETFSLADLLKADGSPVKDVNDLAYCAEDVWLDPELRGAFVRFDF
jgi:hypothetical protein